MNRYKVLDSFWIKVSLGMINERSLKREDYPITIYDDGLKAIYYKISKSNLSHFKRCKKLKNCKM